MERVDGWTKRQRRTRDNGWLRFCPDEDKPADVSSQPGSCFGAGRATHGGAALTASYWESGARDPLQPSGRGLCFLCGCTAVPCVSPRAARGAVTKNHYPLSQKYSQASAPAKEASEHSDDAGLFKAALNFVVSSCKGGKPKGALGYGGTGHCPTAAASLLGWVPCLAAAARARKTGGENKSETREDKYAFQHLHLAADSSGRAAVAA